MDARPENMTEAELKPYAQRHDFLRAERHNEDYAARQRERIAYENEQQQKAFAAASIEAGVTIEQVEAVWESLCDKFSYYEWEWQ